MKISTVAYTHQSGFSSDLPEIHHPQLLVLIFGHSGFLSEPAPFATLRARYPQAVFMGCSSAGEILGRSIHDNSLAIALVQFESSTMRIAYADIDAQQDPRQTGRLLADQLSSPDLQGIFVLSDGLHVNGSELSQGFNDIVAKNVTVTGGLAGDGERFTQTWVLQDGKPVSGVIAAIGFYGNIHVGHGSKGGWKPFGPAREVTKAENNILYELAGKPALALYKAYLGEMADGLPATGLRFPLALSKPEENKELVRTILAVDEDTQSLIFAGDIPVGSQAQLMRANLDQLVEGAENAALMCEVDTNREILCISISCVGRRMVMGTDAEEEVEVVVDILPESTTQIGFYSYGEISPFSKGACDLHNQTMTLTTLHE